MDGLVNAVERCASKFEIGSANEIEVEGLEHHAKVAN